MGNFSRRAVLAASGGLAFAASSGRRAAAAEPTFALVQINQQAIFFNQINDGALEAAKRAGAKLVIFNSNDRPAEQNNAIETYIQQNSTLPISLVREVRLGPRTLARRR